MLDYITKHLHTIFTNYWTHIFGATRQNMKFIKWDSKNMKNWA